MSELIAAEYSISLPEAERRINHQIESHILGAREFSRRLRLLLRGRSVR